MLNRETLTALSKDELTRVWFDALKDATATGVQLRNKKRPRVQWLTLVTQELERRKFSGVNG
jgi:hypothetical protein